MSAPESGAGKEVIPLLNANSKSDSKPEANIVSSEDEARVYLKGRFDIEFSPALRERLLAVLKAPCTKVVRIDLSAVTHMDSSGVATLIEALKIARADEIELRLQGLHDRLFRLFESTGILPLFNGNPRGQSGYETV